MNPAIARNSTTTTIAIEPLKAIAQVISNQMGLPEGRCWADYERNKIPPEGLFCVVSSLAPSETISAVDYFDAETNQEVQQLCMLHHLQIDLASIIPDNSARLRKEEVLMALRSFYSMNYLAKNGLGLSWIQSNLTDTSKVEGANYLNRYTTTCSVNALHTKSQAASYFDTFSAVLTVAENRAQDINLGSNPYV
jgi:hypothetical protein